MPYIRTTSRTPLSALAGKPKIPQSTARKEEEYYLFFFFSTAPNFRRPPDKPRLGEDYSMEPVRAGRAGVAVEMVTAGCFWALKSASAPNHSRKGPFLTPNWRDTLRMPLFGSWWPELFAQSTNQISFVQSYKKKPDPLKNSWKTGLLHFCASWLQAAAEDSKKWAAFMLFLIEVKRQSILTEKLSSGDSQPCCQYSRGVVRSSGYKQSRLSWELSF